jgi:hypothetical protein
MEFKELNFTQNSAAPLLRADVFSDTAKEGDASKHLSIKRCKRPLNQFSTKNVIPPRWNRLTLVTWGAFLGASEGPVSLAVSQVTAKGFSRVVVGWWLVVITKRIAIIALGLLMPLSMDWRDCRAAWTTLACVLHGLKPLKRDLFHFRRFALISLPPPPVVRAALHCLVTRISIALSDAPSSSSVYFGSQSGQESHLKICEI